MRIIYKTKENVNPEKYEEVDSIIFSKWIKENVVDYENSFNILKVNIKEELTLLQKDYYFYNENLHKLCILFDFPLTFTTPL